MLNYRELARLLALLEKQLLLARSAQVLGRSLARQDRTINERIEFEALFIAKGS